MLFSVLLRPTSPDIVKTVGKLPELATELLRKHINITLGFHLFLYLPGNWSKQTAKLLGGANNRGISM